MTGAARLSRVLGVVAMALASGCATIPEIKVPEQVKVPVPVACVDPEQRPKAPPVRDDDELLAMPEYQRTLATWAERLRLKAYAEEAEAVIEGCSRIPAGSRPPQ